MSSELVCLLSFNGTGGRQLRPVEPDSGQFNDLYSRTSRIDSHRIINSYAGMSQGFPYTAVRGCPVEQSSPFVGGSIIFFYKFAGFSIRRLLQLQQLQHHTVVGPDILGVSKVSLHICVWAYKYTMSTG